MSVWTTKPLRWYPAAADMVTVSMGGLAWQFGSWFELTPSVSVDTYLSALALDNIGFAAAVSDVEFDIGIGSAGNEVSIGVFRFAGNTGDTNAESLIPLHYAVNKIPAGSRVAVRGRSSAPAVTPAIAIGCYEAFDSDEVTTVSPSTLPSGASGVSLTPSGSAWGNSNWVALSSALPTQSQLAWIVCAVTTDVEYELDVGSGGAGSETVLATLRGSRQFSGFSGCSAGTFPIRPIDLAAGTRLAVRLRKNDTDTTVIAISAQIYADPLVAATEPDVQTLSATSVRSTSATIRGRIDPNGVDVTGYFLWGTDPDNLLEQTDPVPIGSGSSFISFTAPLSSLTPDTTYYYRAVAFDGTEEYFGAILSFATLGEQQFIDGRVSFPLTWITPTYRDGDKRPYAEVDLNDAPTYYDGYKAPLVLRFHTISRGLSDRDGQIEHLSFGALLSDTSREFRGLLEDETNKYLTNRPLEEWFIDDEERRVEGLARLAAVGYLNDYAPRPNLQFEMKGADWLKKKFSRKRKAQQSWQPLITIEDFPNAPEEVINTPAPLVYGSLGLTGADPVENVTITVNAQPTAAPGSFALSLQAGGRHSGVRRYYKVSQIVGGLESEQSAILSATTTDSNRTIRSSWTPSGSATAIYLYSSDKVDFSQFALTILPGSATQYDDDTTPPNQDARHLDGTDWVLGLRLNLKYYVYAKLADGLYSRPGIASTFLAPVPVRAKVPADRTGPLRQRDIDVAWSAHPDEVDGYRIVRWRSYYSDWSPLFDRQIDVGTGVLTTTDDIVTTSSVDIPTDELTALSASGQVEAIPVGELDGGSPDDTLNGLLVCRCASARVGNIYIPVTQKNVEGEDETTYEPIPESAFGVTWFAPDHAGWLFGDKFVDINGRRYTLIFTTVSPLPEQVFVDVDGIETDGDGNGTLITSIVDQRLHFMNNFIAPDTPYQSGAYLTAADTVFPHIPGLTLVDPISHAIVKASLAERLGTGDYEGATIIGASGEFVTATDALARFQVSGDFDQTFNRKGQDTISCEPIAPTDDPPAVTDIISIRDGSFGVQDLVQTAFFNILPYVHSRDYTGRHRIGWYGSGEERSQTSIDNYDQERESPRFELHCLRANTAQGLATLQDVMARKLARFQDPFRVGTMVLPFSALDYEPGSSVAVSHIEGIGASGWVGKEVRITRHEVEPTDGLVRLDFYDLTKVFENQGSP